MEIEKALSQVRGLRCKGKVLQRLFMAENTVAFDEDETEGVLDQLEAMGRRLDRLEITLIEMKEPPSQEDIALLERVAYSRYDSPQLEVVS
jgi:Glu-tRNA(Gln) amidotransferase subunit E-like FAD-binding protein